MNETTQRPAPVPLDDSLRFDPPDPAHVRRVRLLAGVLARELDRLPTDVSPVSLKQRRTWVRRRVHAWAWDLDCLGLDTRDRDAFLNAPRPWRDAAQAAWELVKAVAENLHDGVPLAAMFPLPDANEAAS